MSDIAVSEFPFVAELPKREKSKLLTKWDQFNELRAVMKEKGNLIPQILIANLLDVSRCRVGQIVDDGRLESVDVFGTRYVTENSFVEFCKLERKTGRPVNLPTTFKESYRRAKASRKATK